MTSAIRHAAAALLLPLAVLRAQSSQTVHRGDRYVDASVAASFYTVGGPHFAAIRDRNLFVASVGAEWVLETAGPIALSTTMELVPLAIVSRRGGPLRDCWTERTGRSRCQAAEPEPTFGMGGHPFGLKLYVWNQPRARVYADGSAGLLFFSRDMPIAGSRQMNFSANYGFGTEFTTISGSSIQFGWKFQHMSNGY